MLAAYSSALSAHQPYRVATAALAARLHPSPLGLQPGRAHDPTLRATAPLLHRLEALDELLYGLRALSMPRWAFYDCAELPGLICGFCRKAQTLPPRVREALGVAGEEHAELEVPVSMSMMVPTLQRDRWLIYTLCDLHERAPAISPAALGLLTLCLGLASTGATRAMCVTQWSSSKLGVLARFAPLRLRAAFLPAHSLPPSCVLELDCAPPAIERALQLDTAERDLAGCRWIDTGDAQALLALQRELETPARLQIAGAPRYRGGLWCAPVEMQP